MPFPAWRRRTRWSISPDHKGSESAKPDLQSPFKKPSRHRNAAHTGNASAYLRSPRRGELISLGVNRRVAPSGLRTDCSGLPLTTVVTVHNLAPSGCVRRGVPSKDCDEEAEPAELRPPSTISGPSPCLRSLAAPDFRGYNPTLADGYQPSFADQTARKLLPRETESESKILNPERDRRS